MTYQNPTEEQIVVIQHLIIQYLASIDILEEMLEAMVTTCNTIPMRGVRPSYNIRYRYMIKHNRRISDVFIFWNSPKFVEISLKIKKKLGLSDIATSNYRREYMQEYVFQKVDGSIFEFLRDAGIFTDYGNFIEGVI